MKCPKCGNEDIKEGDNFCIACGEKLKVELNMQLLAEKEQLRLRRK